jgi:molybdopterin synthase catalytic subunit
MTRAKHKPYQWIDGETADRITSLNLKDYRAYLKKELKKWQKNPKSDANPNGVWMHPEDVTSSIQTIAALDVIISHFISTEDEPT